jgi:hypothetical protein
MRLEIVLLMALLALPVWAGGELGLVVVLHRHGDRAPIGQSPPAVIPASLYAKQWPLGGSELTAHGMLQLYNLGVSLRAQYGGFLSQRFDPKLHYLRSTDFHRTLQSAQSLAYGLYVGTGPTDALSNTSLPFRYQPIPISTVPTSIDTLLDADDWASDNCANYCARARERERERECVCVCVCMCVRERQGERATKKQRKTTNERERERERISLLAYTCVSAWVPCVNRARADCIQVFVF